MSLDGWGTVQVPRRWHVTQFTGTPATVYFPLEFFSTDQLSPMCPAKITPSCVAPNWFAPSWTVPADGVIVLWSHTEFPTGPALAHVSGRAAVIDGRPARVRSGAATSECPSGAASEIDAYVSTSALSGERFDMTACLGSGVSTTDRRSVLTMVTSLHRKYR